MSDPKQNINKENVSTATPATTATLTPHAISTGNHLDVPQNNPNLLSPDVLNQRRGKYN